MTTTESLDQRVTRRAAILKAHDLNVEAKSALWTALGQIAHSRPQVVSQNMLDCGAQNDLPRMAPVDWIASADRWVAMAGAAQFGDDLPEGW